MNNTMCLGCFLLVIYTRNLRYTYTSEVMVTVVPTLLVGWLATRGRTLRAAWALPLLALYPAALLAQLVLKYVLHIK